MKPPPVELVAIRIEHLAEAVAVVMAFGAAFVWLVIAHAPVPV